MAVVLVPVVARTLTYGRRMRRVKASLSWMIHHGVPVVSGSLVLDVVAASSSSSSRGSSGGRHALGVVAVELMDRSSGGSCGGWP
jgi:hypothetical protein